MNTVPDNEIQIQIRSFAQLREKMGVAAYTLRLPAGSPLADLQTALLEVFPAIANDLPGVKFAVNQSYVRDLQQVLNDGDEVALIPPVSGG